MDEKIFKLTKIDGDYAYLTELGSAEEIFIALSLLPMGSDIGSMLLYKDFSFELYN